METAGGGRWRHGVHECARFWPHASNGLPIERIRFVWPPGSTNATALCVQLARRAAGQDQCVHASTLSRTDACPPALSRAHACVPMHLFSQNNSKQTLQPSRTRTIHTHTHTHAHTRGWAHARRAGHTHTQTGWAIGCAPETRGLSYQHKEVSIEIVAQGELLLDRRALPCLPKLDLLQDILRQEERQAFLNSLATPHALSEPSGSDAGGRRDGAGDEASGARRMTHKVHPMMIVHNQAIYQKSLSQLLECWQVPLTSALEAQLVSRRARIDAMRLEACRLRTEACRLLPGLAPSGRSSPTQPQPSSSSALVASLE